MANESPVTVSDLTQLIQARAETRAELRLLAIKAYEHWLELERRIEELESRLDAAFSCSSAFPNERRAEPGPSAPLSNVATT
ncbi:MAG: hypothetical protein EOO73_31895 [Myxococcales bacterium]|nr:MAG: hypothetical protein EOO73_31895 [Myxococcales bacterium]